MHRQSINRRFINPQQHHLTLILRRRFLRKGGTIWRIFAALKVLISCGNMHDFIFKAFLWHRRKN